MRTEYLGDAKDLFKRALLQYLHDRGVIQLTTLYVLPMTHGDDEKQWRENRSSLKRLYAGMLGVALDHIDWRPFSRFDKEYFSGLEAVEYPAVFLDPDKGITVSDHPTRMHVSVTELCRLAHNRVVVVFDDTRNRRDDPYEHVEKLGRKLTCPWCAYHSGSVGMFFVTCRSCVARRIERQLRALVGRGTQLPKQRVFSGGHR